TDTGALTRSLQRVEPWCAALVPLGDDERGTWLVPLEAGSCVAVLGPRATDLVLAMRAAVATWSWHEDLVVTDDVEEVIAALDAIGPASQGPHAPLAPHGAKGVGRQVLYVGDPEALPAVLRRACAVLTTRRVDDAEVTVLVDGRAASAHPLGLTVRPPLLDVSWEGAVDGLANPEGARPGFTTGPGGGGGTAAPVEGDRPRAPRPLVRRSSAPASLRVTEEETETATTPPFDLFSPADAMSGADAAAGPSGPSGPSGDADMSVHPDASGAPAHRRATVAPAALAPAGTPVTTGNPVLLARGRAEVRLLATMPGIVGLQTELPPKRARRAVEVVAYLAMHAPDPVTGDRLRTRVLGSADIDAAAKTLFNTVGAARRALGVAPDGGPLLPPASRTGHYRLSPLVTVDALRACALLREGLRTRDRAESLARLHDGLELVKGEPLGGVLSGYAWWGAEGHERRVADAVVDGSCALIRAALGSGQLDLARWALVQARKVEPYSESLSRAAMHVAAACGDAHRLHAEWRECRRQVDELDPGGVPSERTERLYAQLRARLAGGAAVGSAQASFAAIDAAPFRTVPSAPSTV
ncbi:MAG TPA: bacterial transcriptional activator domain-containing protein, partial [Acidimicrobiales bacterium]|nr:bacterial transcriptional activator domain-containing protein [Acidimicrobiales bacterium]